MTQFNFYGDWNTPLPAGHSQAGGTVHPDRGRDYSLPFSTFLASAVGGGK